MMYFIYNILANIFRPLCWRCSGWYSYCNNTIVSNSFIYQLMYNTFALKNIKIYIKTAPTCFGSVTIIRERIIW